LLNSAKKQQAIQQSALLFMLIEAIDGEESESKQTQKLFTLLLSQ
jgi:hypothetical protein